MPVSLAESAILTEVQDGVATLTVNCPAVRNAIDDAMRTELIEGLERLGRDAFHHCRRGRELRHELHPSRADPRWRRAVLPAPPGRLSRAKELIFTGRKVDPAEALSLGMIDRVTAPDRLLQDARSWAAELSHGSAAALALSKAILDQTFEATMDQMFAAGSQAQAICYTTPEHHKSVNDFLAKTGKAGG